MTIRCLVDTIAAPGYVPEFGLSLFIEANGRRILFDTGTGEGLVPNAARRGLDHKSATDIVLSHGHGALAGRVETEKIRGDGSLR